MNDPIGALRRQRLILASFAIVLCSWIGLPVFADNALDAPKPASEEIAELIEQLDSHDFEIREQASKKLADIGTLAIGPLALHSVACSSETRWRIKKTLEAICTTGDEDDFYKCSGILQLRYGGSGNEQTQRRFAELKVKWKNEVRKRNISQLKAKGAKIVGPASPRNALAQPNPNFIFLDSTGFDTLTTNPPFKTWKVPTKKLSKSAMTKRIEIILKSDTETNRKLVFGDEPEQDAATPNELRQQQFQMIRNGVLIQQQPAVWRQPNSVSPQGIQITLPKSWEGELEDFELISEISPIAEFKISDQKLDIETMEAIAAIGGISNLTFADCKLPELEEDDSLPLPPSVRVLQLENQNLTIAQLNELKSCPNLVQVTIANCQMEKNAIESLGKIKSLSIVEFRSMDLDQAMFETLADMNNLEFINLSAVKFDPQDHDQFRKARPNVRIEFQARAFLGVRGPTVGLGDLGCEISAVIPGSGAEEAGIKVGDIIKSVDDTRVNIFGDLRLIIAKHAPGDVLNIKVRRGEENVEFKVKLKDIASAPDN